MQVYVCVHSGVSYAGEFEEFHAFFSFSIRVAEASTHAFFSFNLAWDHVTVDSK